MLRYFAIRLLQMIPKLLVISVIIFIGLEMVPGDPITRTVSWETYANMTPAQLDELRENLGLNDPGYVRYFRWIRNVFAGDFGYSLVSGGSIGTMLANRLPATLALSLCGLLIATFFGLLLGYLSAVKKNSPLDYTSTILGLIGISVPEFVLGMLAILIFSIRLGWFPVGGRLEYGREGFFDRLYHIILPACCLGLFYTATLMRYTRGTMLDVMNKEYIKTARSKGLSPTEVNLKHGLRNAIIPVMVILIFRLPMLVSGTVVIENVFNYTGIGSMLLSAISGKDMPVVMITTMLIASVILLSSFLVDIITAMLDPRIRIEGGSEGS